MGTNDYTCNGGLLSFSIFELAWHDTTMRYSEYLMVDRLFLQYNSDCFGSFGSVNTKRKIHSTSIYVDVDYYMIQECGQA